MAKKELITLISELPQEFLPIMLTLFPLKRELEKANSNFHFIKKYQETYPLEKKESFIFSELVNIAHAQNLGSKILVQDFDLSTFNKILESLPEEYLWTSIIGFISNSSLQKKYKNYQRIQKELKEKISNLSCKLSIPIFSESLYFLSLNSSWTERQSLIKDQIDAFKNEIVKIKKLEPLQQFLRTNELYQLIKKDKQDYISIQNGNFFQKIWNWIYSLFEKNKKSSSLIKEIDVIEKSITDQLGESILNLFEKNPQMSLIPIIKEHLSSTAFDSSMLIFLLKKYSTSVNDLQEPHRVRKIIHMLCELCHVNPYENEIFTQYFLYQKSNSNCPWNEFSNIFKDTNLESIDFFSRYIVELMTLPIKPLNNISVDKSYPVLNNSLNSIESFSNYLKISSSLGVSIPLESLSTSTLLNNPDNLKKIINMKEFFEIFDANDQDPFFEKIIKELSLNNQILNSAAVQSFYQRLPSDLKIYFIEQTINGLDQEQLNIFDESLNVQEISEKSWKHFIEAEDLSLSILEYLIQKISSQPTISESNFKLLHELIGKFIDKISKINCSDAFSTYAFNLLTPYFIGKFGSGVSYSLEEKLYAAFERSSDYSTSSLIIGLIGFEFGSYSQVPTTTQFRLFKAFHEISDTINASPNSYSTIIGLFSTQSNISKQQMKFFLNELFQKNACHEPALFIEKEKEILTLSKSLDIEHCSLDHADRLLCARILCKMDEATTLEEAIAQIKNWPCDQFNLMSTSLKDLFQKNLSQKFMNTPWNKLVDINLMNRSKNLSNIQLLQNVLLNPQSHIERMLQQDSIYHEQSFFNIKPEIIDLLYCNLNEETIINLAQRFIQDFEQELPPEDFINFCLNFLEKKLPDSKYHWSTHLEGLATKHCALKFNQKEQQQRALHLITQLEMKKSSQLIHQLNPFKNHALKKLDLLARLEVECLTKIQKILGNSIDYSIFDQAKILIKGSDISQEEIEALSSDIRHPLKLKIAQYMILTEIINFNLDNQEATQTHLRSLDFLIQHGESSGIKRRAKIVFDYLCRGRGSNSHSLGEPDFESGASAYSATSASANNHKFFWTKKQ